MDQYAAKKSKEREEILKRLVSSQDTYIKELEQKNAELEEEMRTAGADSVVLRHGDEAAVKESSWQREKALLLDLVEKN